jgi:hypothetical protein
VPCLTELLILKLYEAIWGMEIIFLVSAQLQEVGDYYNFLLSQLRIDDFFKTKNKIMLPYFPSSGCLA